MPKHSSSDQETSSSEDLDSFLQQPRYPAQSSMSDILFSSPLEASLLGEFSDEDGFFSLEPKKSPHVNIEELKNNFLCLVANCCTAETIVSEHPKKFGHLAYHLNLMKDIANIAIKLFFQIIVFETPKYLEVETVHLNENKAFRESFDLIADESDLESSDDNSSDSSEEDSIDGIKSKKTATYLNGHRHLFLELGKKLLDFQGDGPHMHMASILNTLYDQQYSGMPADLGYVALEANPKDSRPSLSAIPHIYLTSKLVLKAKARFITINDMQHHTSDANVILTYIDSYLVQRVLRSIKADDQVSDNNLIKHELKGQFENLLQVIQAHLNKGTMDVNYHSFKQNQMKYIRCILASAIDKIGFHDKDKKSLLAMTGSIQNELIMMVGEEAESEELTNILYENDHLKNPTGHRSGCRMM